MLRHDAPRRPFRMLPRLAASAVLVLALAGCNPEEYVVATIAPTLGNTAAGEVRFYKVEGGVRVVAKLEGLTPGAHGFHLHEKGDCSAPDAMSAGGHYNPAGAPHGAPDADGTHRHAGDLGNVEAGADGKATLNRVDPLLVYEDLAGLAVLVHANPDDLTSQPAGNAGPRVGCGVVQQRR
ncbi:MAG TPA: superoxide dismutase family protein [Candidatus Eisenbacteria bacterium]|nr:superoxide dismutase family protein [Candidatus Eisenbacteria bacterium]